MNRKSDTHVGIWMLGIFIFPVMVLVIIPACILRISGDFFLCIYLRLPWNVLVTAAALVLTAAGVLLSLQSCLLFQRFGKGTAVPWVPPKHLVVRGIYLHTRNPMLSGVLCILLGEGDFLRVPPPLSLSVFSVCSVVRNWLLPTRNGRHPTNQTGEALAPVFCF